MNDDLYNLWARRADVEVPADFADRVMAAVRREPPPSSKGVLILMPSSRGVRAAACVLACAACLYRMAAVVAVFFAQ